MESMYLFTKFGIRFLTDCEKMDFTARRTDGC